MQQTEHLKLNLIETGDPISPAPINENAEKLEAALAAETETRQTETAALAQRVTVLELHKMLVGSYPGTDREQIIEVGFTPQAVLICREEYGGGSSFTVTGSNLGSGPNTYLSIVDNGFKIHGGSNPLNFSTYKTYRFIAFA